MALEAGNPAPTWRVGGRPLLERLVRQLAARGVTEVHLVIAEDVEDPHRLVAAAGRALRVLRCAPEDVPGAAVPLQGHGLYEAAALDDWARGGPAPGPAIRVTDAASRARAEDALWTGIRKSLSHDGPVAYYLARPLSRPVTRLAAWTRLPPNLWTGLGLLVGLGAGVAAAEGGYGAGLLAAGLFFVGLLLDCVDGDLARITLTTSRLGQWLDTITDDTSYAALAVGLGVGLYRETGASHWLVVGLGTLALITVGQGIIYRHLARSGGPIDTAQYPWFFMGEAGLAQPEGRSLFGWLSFAARRDALTVYVVVLAALGLRSGILAILAGGSAIYFLLLCVDLLVKAGPGDRA